MELNLSEADSNLNDLTGFLNFYLCRFASKRLLTVLSSLPIKSFLVPTFGKKVKLLDCYISIQGTHPELQNVTDAADISV